MAESQVGAAGSFLDNFVEYVKRALEIAQLNTDEIDRVKGDEEAFTMGLVIIALSGVAAAIGSMAPFGVVVLPVFYLIGAFIGSGVELVAPVKVGTGATIGAGSTISKDVPDDTLVLERSRQKAVPGWKKPVKKGAS